jgi:hypothetical protein
MSLLVAISVANGGFRTLEQLQNTGRKQDVYDEID